MVDQRAIFRNHRHDIMDSGTDGDVFNMGPARRDLMVDWVVHRGIRLDGYELIHDFLNTLNLAQ